MSQFCVIRPLTDMDTEGAMHACHKTALALVAAFCLLAWSLPSQAQPCFARQLMSPNEWRQHQATLWSLPPAQREVYRAQHHEQMKRRAAAQGVVLPHQPPPMGLGMGRRMVPRAWIPGYGPGWSPYGAWGRPGWARGPGRAWQRWGGPGRW